MIKNTTRRWVGLFSLMTIALPALSACGGAAGASGMSGGPGVSQFDPSFDPSAPRDPNEIVLALKYVNLIDSSGKPVISQEQTKKVVVGINQFWAQCGIRFVLEDIQEVQATSKDEFNLSSMAQLDPLRAKYDNPKQLVVTNTGDWSHGGMSAANAWTTMPGQSPSGAVIEGQVATSPEIIAHELGHYLNLDHVSDQANLMNPVIYKTSTFMSQSQCAAARTSAATDRAQARR